MKGQQVKSLSLTIKLLRTIGSPFVSEQKQLSPENKEEALELYEYATKNKIGLAYLESLKDQERLEEFGLKGKYEEEKKKHDEQQVTASRISELFNSHGINYAIFKSIMPFPATPNDVDIIHFGSDDEFNKAAKMMLQSGYIEVKPKADSLQREFHDAKRGGYINPHPHEKDIYDIDLYQETAASYLVYLDKIKLTKHVVEINIRGNHLRVLKPEAELVAIITHSIIPEQLFTLLAYYATLYYLADRNFNIDEFIHIAKENNVTYPVRVRCFISNDLKMPHRYSIRALVRTVVEKLKERVFRRSLIKQIISMSNPRLAKWVIENIIWRRMRETY